MSSSLFSEINLLIQPEKTENKIRMGRRFDGGYLVTRDLLKATKILISLGINDEWSFEADCLMNGSIDRLIMIDDRSSSKLIRYRYFKSGLRRLANPFSSWAQSNYILNKNKYQRFNELKAFANVAYCQGRIGNIDGNLTLSQVYKKYLIPGWGHHVLLKMDIEGAEYSVVKEIIKSQMAYCGMVIEFHDALSNPGQLLGALKLILEYFIPIHVHFNNYSDRNEWIADVIEITFMHQALRETASLDFRNYPLIGLDFPCNPEIADYEIRWVRNEHNH